MTDVVGLEKVMILKKNYLSPELDERQDSHLVLNVCQEVCLLLVLLLELVLEPLAAFQHLAEKYIRS